MIYEVIKNIVDNSFIPYGDVFALFVHIYLATVVNFVIRIEKVHLTTDLI